MDCRAELVARGSAAAREADGTWSRVEFTRDERGGPDVLVNLAAV